MEYQVKQREDNMKNGNRTRGRKRKITAALAVVVAVLLLASCTSEANNAGYDTDSINGGYYTSDSVSGIISASGSNKAPSNESSNGDYNYNDSYGDSTDIEKDMLARKLIVTMRMDVETSDCNGLTEWIEDEIGAVGGYIAYQQANNYSSRKYCTLTLRVPSGNLEQFLERFSGQCNVVSRTKEVEDVTLDYTDTESHKEALEIEYDRLLDILSKAEELDDIITLENRLTSVRYELDSLESQLRLYDNLIDYSTVYVGITEVTEYTEPEPEGFWARAGSAFKESLKKLKENSENLVVSLIGAIPTILAVAIGIVILVFALKLYKKILLKREDSSKEPKEDSLKESKESTGSIGLAGSMTEEFREQQKEQSKADKNVDNNETDTK